MFKATMLFQSTTSPGGVSPDPARTGGWSESVYFDGTIEQLRIRMGSLCSARAALLPANTFIVGQRYQVVGGGSSTTGVRYNGTAGTAQDIPQMAVLYYIAGVDVANISKLTLRGLPDARVVGGEYAPSLIFDSSLLQYSLVLGFSGFKFKARSLTAETRDILSIAADGTAALASPSTFVSGDKVRLLRVRNIAGRSVSGLYTVITGSTVSSIKLSPWDGIAATTGKMRKEVIITPTFVTTGGTRGRVITKKVGSPFGKYRGRRSKRR